MSQVRLLDGQILIASSAIALSEDCCCDDACGCHPENWDWEALVAGLSCSEFNGTHVFPSGGFSDAGAVLDCRRWRQSTGAIDLGGGTFYKLTLEIFYLSTTNKVRALLFSERISGSFLSFSFPESDVADGCAMPSSVSVGGTGDCGASSATAEYTAT